MAKCSNEETVAKKHESKEGHTSNEETVARKHESKEGHTMSGVDSEVLQEEMEKEDIVSSIDIELPREKFPFFQTNQVTLIDR